MEYVLIKDIRPGQKNINVVFIVLEVGQPVITKENREVRMFKVADSTACMNVSIWEEPGQLLAPGDIVRLTKGYASVWKQCLTLYSGKDPDIRKIGDFCMVINEQLNMSEPNPALAEQPLNQGGFGPPARNCNNAIANNGNADNAAFPPGRRTPSVTTPATSTTTSFAPRKGGNGGSAGLPWRLARFSGKSGSKSSTAGRGGSRGRGGYPNGGRSDRG
ncbi:SOSS complex subunit B homolog [Athalia rosae]|uniref:SOSS complex subunit B homolog n=1 Tax=Athalia rosae TaxID=37344 RepID=UPI002033D910|nr:SOSS complex subunit B homolog [Athalia rosae]